MWSSSESSVFILIDQHFFYRSEAKDGATNVAKFASLPFVHDGSLHRPS
jgi:hypothetical protein